MSANTANARSTNGGTVSSSNANHRPSTSSNGSAASNGALSSSASPTLIRISPQGFQFTASKHSSGQVSKLRMKNLWSTPVGYKFKTNAPLRYSVKPVLGVMAPGQTIEVFVRCESWVNPQDRFLLQSVALSEAESEKIDSVSWRALDVHRIVETYIQCSSASSLTLKDQHDDNSSVSSRTSMSSTRSSVSSRLSSSPGHTRSTTTTTSTTSQKQQSLRKGSPTSSTPPGSYPTLFGADKKGGRPTATRASATTNGSSNSSHSLWASLSDFRQSLKTLRTFLAVRQYTKLQVVTVSVICLLLGLLLPFERLFVMVSNEPKLVRHHNHGAATASHVLPLASAAPIVTYQGQDTKHLKNAGATTILAVVDRRKEVQKVDTTAAADTTADTTVAAAAEAKAVVMPPSSAVILVDPSTTESLNIPIQQEPEGSV
ncbi:hypothetical protein BGW42_003431 [Actinomortierella wolfii]|nr:hypothetical protein BGW42_003431 [Actinomortierella wolfii]